jgi:hypothetical protein
MVSSSLNAFYNKCFTPVKVYVANNIIDQIKMERDGKVVDRDNLKSAIEVYVVMGIVSTVKDLKLFKYAPMPSCFVYAC